MPHLIMFSSLSALIFGSHFLVSVYLSSSLAGQSLPTLMVSTYLGFALSVAASSLLSKKSDRVLNRLAIAVLFSSMLSLYLLNRCIDNLNQSVLASAANLQSQNMSLENLLITERSSVNDLLFLSLFLPFFVYGLFFGAFVGQVKSLRLVKVVALEAMSAAAGLVLVIFLVENLGWKWSVFLLHFIATVALIYFFIRLKQYTLAISVFAVLFVFLFNLEMLAPVSNTSVAGRDYLRNYQIDVLKESWNSYSRVQTLVYKSSQEGAQDKRYAVISIGDGTGHAQVPFVNATPTVTSASVLALSPKSVLVLFAGAGAELAQLSNAKNAPYRVVGVELNGHVIDHGFDLAGDWLSDIASRSQQVYQLQQSDARSYLESCSQKFDTILFSWSGATVAHYTGAVMHTTQYTFTREAIRSALHCLNENGHIVFFGASKAALIIHLKNILHKDIRGNVILFSRGEEQAWKKNWDNDILVFGKNERAVQQNFSRLEHAVSQFGYGVAFSDFGPIREDYSVLASAIRTTDIDTAERILLADSKLSFHSRTDDDPFVYQMNKNYILTQIKNFVARESSWSDLPESLRFAFVILLMSGVLGVYYSVEKDFKNSLSRGVTFTYVYLVGISFSCIQFIVIYKFILFIGNPNIALSGGLVSSMFSSFLSALVIEHISKVRSLVVVGTAFGAGLIVTVLYLMNNTGLGQQLFLMPEWARLSLLMLIFGSGSVLWGIGYTSVLKEASHLIEFGSSYCRRIVVIDTLGSALASLTVPLLIEDHGMFKVSSVLLLLCLVALLILQISKHALHERGAS